MKKAIFLDKDGTLIEDVPYNVNPELVTFSAGAFEALRKFRDLGFLLIVVSNQSGVARGYFTLADLDVLQKAMAARLRDEGIALDAVFFCPHHPAGHIAPFNVECNCRKPKAGMMVSAAAQFDINMKCSWMIGDILNDVEAGNRAGCKTILLDNGNETEWEVTKWRQPTAIVNSLTEAAEVITNHFELV